MEEIWKDIPGYEGLYRVSNIGRVWSVYHSRILSNKKAGRGYLSIQLCKKGVKRRFYIHRLVAGGFLPVPDKERCEINHKNLDKTNNCVSNLEWVTPSENFEHAYRNGRVDYRRPLRSDNKTGAAGVCAHSGGYQVTLNLCRVKHYIGWYKDLDQAIEARLDAERRLTKSDESLTGFGNVQS